MKQGNKMKKIFMFISSMSMLLSGVVIADNMMPPTGPYRSLEGDFTSYNKAFKNMQGAENIQRQNWLEDDMSITPERVKKRQDDMNNWNMQLNNQAVMQRGRQYMLQPNSMQQKNEMQRNQRQPVPMNPPIQAFIPQGVNPQLSQPQMNRMKQYFPTSRGPVYGPNVPPPAVRHNQNNPPLNQYPPMWR